MMKTAHKCSYCHYSKWTGKGNTYLCTAFPNLISEVQGDWYTNARCLDRAKKGLTHSDFLEKQGAVVIRTFLNDWDDEIEPYWDTETLPAPKGTEDEILVVWRKANEGFTISLDTGSRYEFCINRDNGEIVSESPACQRGSTCKHQLAIGGSFDARPVDDEMYIPF